MNADNTAPVRTHRGPENRMNDLSYTEWMKFQKSFFDFASLNQIVRENVLFFTKEIWPSGQPSTSMVITAEDLSTSLLGRRIVEMHRADGPSSILHALDRSDAFDFILIDLRTYTSSPEAWHSFLGECAGDIYEAVRGRLRQNGYCCLLTGPVMPRDLPTPWLIGLHGRGRMRLRDEKIGLLSNGGVLYSLYFQAQPDGRLPVEWNPSQIRLAKSDMSIPAYLKPKSPPRGKEEMGHPAKFPESLISEFIQIFTGEGDAIIDPMVGTGSALVAAVRCGRTGVGVDLNSRFVDLARKRVDAEYPALPMPELLKVKPPAVFQGDARLLPRMHELESWGSFEYCITSPPYWSVLRNPGSENQRARRQRKLPLTYSPDPKDLGNVDEYDLFLNELVSILNGVAEVLKDRGVLTVVVKNVKRYHIVYPLAWDLLLRLCSDRGRYAYLGTTFWCQDDVGLKPFAVGHHWVSNVLHQYCLHFRKES